MNRAVQAHPVFPTVEVRWFCPGTIPAEVLAWFQGAGREPALPASRVDYYLSLSEGDSLGIKLREGRIEIKQREGVRGDFSLGDRIAGRLEKWSKWSFELAATQAGAMAVPAPAAAWIGVRKSRLLRRYGLRDDGHELEVPADSHPELACDWELTEVRLGEGVWWTVGFEASGKKAALREMLLITARNAFRAAEPPGLVMRDSYGYPRWLQSIVGAEGS